MNEIVIRKARAKDLTAIKELWIEFFDFHYTRDAYFTRAADGHERFGEYVASNIKDPDWLVLVAVDGEGVVGYVMAKVQTYPPVFEKTWHGFISDIAVTERYRGQGVGRQLYERTATWFQEKGVSQIELYAASANEVSQAFWKHLGFRDFMVRLVKEL